MGIEELEVSESISEKINYLKFMLMILVVYIHSSELPVFEHQIIVPEWLMFIKDVIGDIASVAVPGFFILSSYLLYRKHFSWVSNLRKKAKGILVPYLIINTFWVLFFVLFSSIPKTAVYFTSDQYQIETWRDVLLAYFGHKPLYYPFWFLQDLMVLNVLAPLIHIAYDRFPALTLSISACLIHSGINIPLLNDKMSILYWMVGLILVNIKFSFDLIDRFKVYDLAGASVATVVLSHYNCLPLVIHVIVLGAFLYQLGSCLYSSYRDNRLLKICTRQTFIIYSFHEFWEAMLKKVLMTVFPQTGIVQLLEYLLLPLFIVMACIMAGKLLEKQAPSFYRVINGNRSLTAVQKKW